MTADTLTLGLTAAVIALGVWLVLRRGSTSPAIVSLAGLKWTRADFCRGWLITGDTGSGKTRSGITPLLCQVFQNEPGWGGLCIDDKGLYWETLCEMAKHFGRENDLILLQVRPDAAPTSWQPRHTYNLTSDRSIPYNTFSKAVVDTASSLGQAGDKGFFKNQAQVHIACLRQAEVPSGTALRRIHAQAKKSAFRRGGRFHVRRAAHYDILEPRSGGGGHTDHVRLNVHAAPRL